MRQLLVLMVLMVTCSCGSTLQETCAQALPKLNQATVYVDNAQESVERAAWVIDTSAMPDERKAEALAALQEVRRGIFAATSLLAEASGVCRQPDLPTIFAAVVKAWTVLAPLLPLLGGPAGYVEPPIVYSQAMSGELR